VKFGLCFLRYASVETDRQTDIETDTLIAILRTAIGGEITTT